MEFKTTQNIGDQDARNGGPSTIKPSQEATATETSQPSLNLDHRQLDTPKMTGSRVEFKNIDGRSIDISVDSLRYILPADRPEKQSDAKLIESGWLMIDNRGNEMLITKDGFIFGFRGDDYARHNHEKLTLNDSGMPIAKDGSEMAPRARLIVVGEGTLLCAPPNIQLKESQPQTGIFKKLRDLYEKVFTPPVAECRVDMSGECYLDYGGPGPGGYVTSGGYHESVKFSVNRSGGMSLSSDVKPDSKVFLWEQELEAFFTASSKLYEKMTKGN